MAGLWSSTVGKGNSFGQSVANVLTPNDGQVYDNGNKTQQYNAFGDPVKSDGSNSDTSLGIPYPTTGNNDYDALYDESTGNSGAGGLVSAPAASAPAAPSYTASLGTDQVLKWAEETGLVKSQADMQAIIDDPDSWLAGKGLSLADVVPSMDANADGTVLDSNDPKYNIFDDIGYNAETVDATEVAPVISTSGPETYDISTATDKLTDATKVDAATGTIDSDNLVDDGDITINIEAERDGTGVLGSSLDDFASQRISTIIDTTTIGGKLLAEKLGEGNYTDAKATAVGQMKIISDEFKNSKGDPIIPTWAQGIARDTRRTIAFSGMSGSAAIEAYSNAIMEATLGVAQNEASFFQTLTVKNLDNRQQSIINKAQVLSNFELANLNARESAAVTNAQAFLQMDLSNLTNEQQSEVVNKQAMVQALFEDQKVINTQRLFTAETNNEFEKFYDQLNATIAQQNASEMNAMAQFNSGETNTASRFASEQDQAANEFYQNLQYNVDTANAKWRQTVMTANTQMLFEAVSTDVKNRLDLTQEAQNRLWDTVDNLLDYAFKGAVSDMQFETQLLSAQLGAQANSGSNSSGKWGAFGTIVGALAGNPAIFTGSDTRLKKNIVKIDTLKGINFYQWDWNEEGIRIGANKHPTFGVLAQEVQKTHPEAVKTGDHGYLMVNYGMISNEV